VVASHRLPTPPSPELSDRLLAAVAERDGGLANRLLQQWVHRRGLPSLEAWILGPLAASQGPGASAWLRHCLVDSAQEPMAVTEIAAIDQALPGVPDSPAPAPASMAALRAWLPDSSNDLSLAG
jgi:hypothetical protein